MRVITTETPIGLQVMNATPLCLLLPVIERENLKLDIYNGEITEATQYHRDYVWKTDGRNNYIG